MNIKSFDLNLLIAFDALLTERHVSRAAIRVGVTQPAMSNALARLRNAFDDPLFVRAGSKMVLTVRAQALAEPIRQAMHLLSTILDSPSSVSLLARTFVIGATEYAEQLLLPRLLPTLLQTNKAVRVVVRRLPTLFQAPEDDLQAGLLDLAVGFFPEAPSLRPGILSQRVLEDDNVVLVRRGHPTIRKELTIKQYSELSHVSIFYQSDGPGVLDRLLLARGLRRQVVLQVAHLSSAVSLVSQTNFITTLPRRFAAKAARYLPVRFVELPLDVPALQLSVLWHIRSDGDSPLQFVVEQLVRIGGEPSTIGGRSRL